MSRKRSPETELKALKIRFRALDLALESTLTRERTYVERLRLATLEVAEWKARFDALLQIAPKRTDAAQHAEEK